MKLFGIISSFFCSFSNRKTEFNEITDMKKMYKELDSLPNQRREILAKIQDDVMAAQQFVLEDCPVCLEPQNFSSSEGVLLNCGHEVCRTCFMDPNLKKCPKFCKEKKEYKTKFEELIQKENLENALIEYKKKLDKAHPKKGHNKNKAMLSQSIKIEETEYEALKYVFAQKPKKKIARLVRYEVKKFEVKNNKNQTNLAIKNLDRKINVISRYLGLLWLFKKLRGNFNQLDLDAFEDSVFHTYLWFTYFQLFIKDQDDWIEYGIRVGKLMELGIVLFLLGNLLVNIKLIPIKLRRFMRCLCSLKFLKIVYQVALLGYELWRNPDLWWKILLGISLSREVHTDLLFSFFITGTAGTAILGVLYIFHNLETCTFSKFLLYQSIASLGVFALLNFNEIDETSVSGKQKVKKKILVK